MNKKIDRVSKQEAAIKGLIAEVDRLSLKEAKRTMDEEDRRGDWEVRKAVAVAIAQAAVTIYIVASLTYIFAGN